MCWPVSNLAFVWYSQTLISIKAAHFLERIPNQICDLRSIIWILHDQKTKNQKKDQFNVKKKTLKNRKWTDSPMFFLSASTYNFQNTYRYAIQSYLNWSWYEIVKAETKQQTERVKLHVTDRLTSDVLFRIHSQVMK